MSENAEPMNILGLTPKEHRAALKAQCARLFVRLLGDTDIQQKQIAEACGVGNTAVQRWSDKSSGKAPSVVDLVQMPRPMALGLLRWIAEQHGYAIVEAPETLTIEDDAEHLTSTMQECLDVAQKLAAAIGPGHLSGVAQRALDRSAQEAMESLGTLRVRLGSLLPVRPVRVVKGKR